MITVKELAVLAETSVATVSRVLNGNPHVSEATRKRVLEAISATGYVPPKPSKQAEDEILVVLHTLNNPCFQDVLRGIEQKASSCGFNTYFCVTHRNSKNETRYLQSVLKKRTRGVIIISSFLSEPELDAFSMQVPTVLCCSAFNVTNASFVCIDDRQAAYDAIAYLNRIGNSKIAMLSYNQTNTPFVANRHAGYLQALKEFSLPYIPDYDLSCDNSYDDGYECAKHLFALPDKPTAIFTFSEFTGIGVVDYLLEHGMTPGKDIDVLGFDGTSLSEHSNPKLSVMLQPAYNIGKISFEILLDQMTDPYNYVQRQIILSHKLICRATTKPLSNNLT